ncbi:MAG: class I SAM-dependent methyltransferase [Rhodobacteraceae bacterium]|jgi:predicted O-methyltransferase YrrM|nr:class I SAM-dependent methyltransferase [Paracoccaceae bacterium]
MIAFSRFFRPQAPDPDLRRTILAEARDARARVHGTTPLAELDDRHTAACRVVPSRLHLLDRLPKGLAWAEIGVGFGDYSAEILARARPTCLHLVDAWETTRYGTGRTHVATRFAEAIASGRVVLHVGKSTAVMPTLGRGTLDVVYIDTDHSYATTRDELRLAAGLVAGGGRIAGHDYCPGNAVEPVVYGVVQAVAEFCLAEDWGFEYLALAAAGNASFCLRRLSDLQ